MVISFGDGEKQELAAQVAEDDHHQEEFTNKMTIKHKWAPICSFGQIKSRGWSRIADDGR